MAKGAPPPRQAAADERTLLAVFAQLTGRTSEDGEQLGPRRELTRQRIVKAATELLLQDGYFQMRVDDVADSAGVTRPTLYTYFKSKEHLLIAAMSEEAMGQLAGIGRLFDPERPAQERLRDWVREIILYIERAPLTARLVRDRDPRLMKLLMEHELAASALGLKPDLDKARLFSGLVREAFGGAFSQQQADEIASLLRALSHMAPALLEEHLRFGLALSRLADLLSDLLVDGMAAAAQRSSP